MRYLFKNKYLKDRSSRSKTVTTSDISTTFDIFTISKLYRQIIEIFNFYETCILLKPKKKLSLIISLNYFSQICTRTV